MAIKGLNVPRLGLGALGILTLSFGLLNTKYVPLCILGALIVALTIGWTWSLPSVTKAIWAGAAFSVVAAVVFAILGAQQIADSLAVTAYGMLVAGIVCTAIDLLHTRSLWSTVEKPLRWIVFAAVVLVAVAPFIQSLNESVLHNVFRFSGASNLWSASSLLVMARAGQHVPSPWLDPLIGLLCWRCSLQGAWSFSFVLEPTLSILFTFILMRRTGMRPATSIVAALAYTCSSIALHSVSALEAIWLPPAIALAWYGARIPQVIAAALATIGAAFVLPPLALVGALCALFMPSENGQRMRVLFAIAVVGIGFAGSRLIAAQELAIASPGLIALLLPLLACVIGLVVTRSTQSGRAGVRSFAIAGVAGTISVLLLNVLSRTDISLFNAGIVAGAAARWYIALFVTLAAVTIVLRIATTIGVPHSAHLWVAAAAIALFFFGRASLNERFSLDQELISHESTCKSGLVADFPLPLPHSMEEQTSALTAMLSGRQTASMGASTRELSIDDPALLDEYRRQHVSTIVVHFGGFASRGPGDVVPIQQRASAAGYRTTAASPSGWLILSSDACNGS